MLKVNYLTRPWFFDISLELIKELKHKVELNVIIVIAPATAGYLGLTAKDFDKYKNKTLSIDKVLTGEAYQRLYHYFDGANVLCKFEEHKESSYKNLLGWFKLLKKNSYLLGANLNIIETLSLADWYWLFRIRNRKIFYIIHDPVPHTGEGRKRDQNMIKIYFPFIDKFITYSQFSSKLFSKHFIAYKHKLLTLKMPVFDSHKIRGLVSTSEKNRRKIVFFGRISPYKGVELFYEAAANLAEKYSDVDFIIAGKVFEDYQPYFLEHNPFENIIIKNRFIDLKELNVIMQDAYLCVLPYLDATQSGVIMTSYAFNLPVLISNCEGLLEYCFDKEHFSFSNNNLESLTSQLEQVIENPDWVENYKQEIIDYKQENISSKNSDKIIEGISSKS